MRVAQMNWMQLEAQAKRDDRCLLPIASTEQHAYLSLCTDVILAERVATEAAELADVPVFPAIPFGLAAGFTAFPGTVSLRLATFALLLEDVLDSLYRGGFRRILVVNGHGGNAPAGTVFAEWMNRNPGTKVRLHDWWRAPKTWEAVMAIDRRASHASWMENFPWTRIQGVVQPDGVKAQVPPAALAGANADRVRALVGDGNYHGLYERSDDEMLEIWRVAVAETRALIDEGW
jgi:creatinine amidohydrolase